MAKSKKKSEVKHPIVELLTKHHITFRQLSSYGDVFDWEIINEILEDKDYSEEEIQMVVSELKELILNEDIRFYIEDYERDGQDCTEIRVMFFSKFNQYIKEVVVGECNYKDTVIDGDIYTTDYYLVEPKEIKVIDYVDVSRLN